MARPVIAITPWRRTVATWVHPRSDLYTLNPDYVTGVEKAGGRAVLVPHVGSADEAAEVLDTVDGLIVSGGADIDPEFYGHDNVASMRPDPAADTSDLAFVAAARRTGRPVLAICRGAQILNVALGGTLHQHIWADDGDHRPRADTGDALVDSDEFLARRHAVDLAEGSRVAGIFGSTRIDTNSLHHQSIDRVGSGLVVTGTTADGVVEVVEHPDEPLLGVQWHPERLTDEGHQPLFDWLVGTARPRS